MECHVILFSLPGSLSHRRVGDGKPSLSDQHAWLSPRLNGTDPPAPHPPWPAQTTVLTARDQYFPSPLNTTTTRIIAESHARRPGLARPAWGLGRLGGMRVLCCVHHACSLTPVCCTSERSQHIPHITCYRCVSLPRLISELLVPAGVSTRWVGSLFRSAVLR